MATSTDRFVEQQRVVNAAPDVVFTVLTAPADMVGWLSNEARCETRPGGIYDLRWNTGYAVHGEVKDAQKPRLFSVSWQGSGEPARRPWPLPWRRSVRDRRHSAPEWVRPR